MEGSFYGSALQTLFKTHTLINCYFFRLVIVYMQNNI